MASLRWSAHTEGANDQIVDGLFVHLSFACCKSCDEHWIDKKLSIEIRTNKSKENVFIAMYELIYSIKYW